MDESYSTQRMQKVIDNPRKIGVDTAITPKGLTSGKEESST